jgi:hypothetical protein
MLGHDFEQAWKTIARTQGDMAHLSRDELMDRYFHAPLQAKLSDYLPST